MPVLNWIGKDAVVRHDAEVPFRLLHDVPELACGDSESGNLIVDADNVLVTNLDGLMKEDSFPLYRRRCKHSAQPTRRVAACPVALRITTSHSVRHAGPNLIFDPIGGQLTVSGLSQFQPNLPSRRSCGELCGERVCDALA